MTAKADESKNFEIISHLASPNDTLVRQEVEELKKEKSPLKFSDVEAEIWLKDSEVKQ